MRVVITQQHVVDVVAKRIDQPTANAVCTILASVEHVPVIAAVGFDGSLHLRGRRELSTCEWVTATRAFCAVTDARKVWHPAVTS